MPPPSRPTAFWALLLLLTFGCDHSTQFLLRGRTVKSRQSPPWMVTLHKERETIFNCAGTLLSSRVVHTAAHCISGVSSSNRMQMTINDYKADVPELDREIVRKGSDFFRAKDHYEFWEKRDDYGLLFFKENVSVCDRKDPHTLSVPLILSPDIFPNITTPQSMEKGKCMVTGWGLDEFGHYEHRLHMATTKHVLVYNDALAVQKYKKHASACNGDSGSPLICNVNGMPILLGNVAGGIAQQSMESKEKDWERCEKRLDIYSYIYRQLPCIKRELENRKLWDDFVETQHRCAEYYTAKRGVDWQSLFDL